MIRSCLRALLLHVGIAVASSGFQAALDDIAAFHRQDAAALARTLESLSTIATRLQLEPDNPKYRNIRLLNKTFWERVGSVNGGIAFMSSLGFDLLGQGAGHGPCFQTRSGAPAEADLRQALDLLSARRVQLGERKKQAHQNADESTANPDAASRSSFNPFATAFSRKSRTHLQARAEHGLTHLCQSQARQQQRFSKLEERNITILLPREHSQQPQETSALPNREVVKPQEEQEEQEDDRKLELVAHLWRERMAHDEVERFETSAARKLRLLRSAKVYPYVVLRVRLPGGMFLQGRFNPEEKWETVYQVIGESLAVEAGYGSDQRLCHNFELFMAPPVRVFPQDTTSLKESNAQAPACVLHLRWTSENAHVNGWAQTLEESMSLAMGDSVHPRVPYSSRYDVPEAISSKRPQGPYHAKEVAHAAGLESGPEPESAESPTLP